MVFAICAGAIITNGRNEDMKRYFGWLVLAIVMHLNTNAFAGGVDSQGRELYRDGEVIVKFRDNVKRARSEMLDLYDRIGAVNVKRLGGINKNFEHLSFRLDTRVDDVIAELERNPAVEYAQPNYMVYISPVTAEAVAPRSDKQPCLIPGIPYPPGCEDGGGGTPPPPGGTPCLIPGLPFPPGCDDSGGGGGGGTERPAIQPLPAEPAAAADPDLSKTYGVKKVQAPEAWAIQRGSKDIVVAVIDTGIDYNHPDLAFNVWRNPAANTFATTGIDPNGDTITGDVVGWDFTRNDNLPFDDNMHGTHCAGTVGAVGNDGVGISGVAQRVSIMGVKFLTKEGSGTTADAIKSIDYAVSRGARILSNSWGGKGDDGTNQALEDSIKRAEVKGVLFVAAAGNDGTNNDRDPAFPAAFRVPNMLTVAATNEADAMTSFSNYGKESVHVGAPGAGVYSTTPNNSYQKLSGTSMAAPHVSGAAAVVWAQFPNANYAEIKRRLMTYGDAVPSLNNKTVSGNRINVFKALTGN
jgi:subtilisin family serine protease